MGNVVNIQDYSHKQSSYQHGASKYGAPNWSTALVLPFNRKAQRDEIDDILDGMMLQERRIDEIISLALLNKDSWRKK